MSTSVSPESTGVAPVAAPQPAAPAAAASPGGSTPEPANHLASALADIRARYQENPGAPAPLPGTEGAPAAPAAPHHSATQPRDDRQRFAGPPEAQPETRPAERPAPGSPETTHGAPTDAEGAEAQQQGDAADPELVEIEAPNRHPHQEPFRFQVPKADTETQQRLQQLVNGYQEGQQLAARASALAEAEQDVEAFRTEAYVDPVGLVSRHVAPEMHAPLVLALLANPAVYEAVAEKLEQFGDEQSRRLIVAETKAELIEKREQLQQALHTQRAVERNKMDVEAAVRVLIPDGMTERQAAIWYRDAIHEIASVAQHHHLVTIDPRQLTTVLEGRLVAWGIDPSLAAQRIDVAIRQLRAGGPQGAVRGARPAALGGTPSPTPTAGEPPAGGPGGRSVQDLRDAEARKRAIAAQGGPGVGSPTAGAGPALPKGAQLADAFKVMRERMAVRQPA